MSLIEFTWSRLAANPVEHIADHTMFKNPICGASLRNETKTGFPELPTGFAPVCSKCLTKLFQFKKVRDGFYRNDFFQVEVVYTPQMLGGGRHNIVWTAQERLSANATAQISVHDGMRKAQAAAVAHIKRNQSVAAVLAAIEKDKEKLG